MTRNPAVVADIPVSWRMVGRRGEIAEEARVMLSADRDDRRGLQSRSGL